MHDGIERTKDVELLSCKSGAEYLLAKLRLAVTSAKTTQDFWKQQESSDESMSNHRNIRSSHSSSFSSCSLRFLERVHYFVEFDGGHRCARQSNIESYSGYRPRSGSSWSLSRCHCALHWSLHELSNSCVFTRFSTPPMILAFLFSSDNIGWHGEAIGRIDSSLECLDWKDYDSPSESKSLLTTLFCMFVFTCSTGLWHQQRRTGRSGRKSTSIDSWNDR